ncbi:DNA polymerase III subunit epsilon [Sodalis sp. CWE]|uniref:DNA polymerase III subunit epsilon n=1 Tax=Sodalis sp. CWE TaxID=2803816 RepID=UPI001C7DE2B8|nr:DNA polymerase III subunit epsilon [Sodalis sp. CWE]MBX4181221.1 DNA polymerase III subunit epsilon [Sodalis sp. CWE]
MNINVTRQIVLDTETTGMNKLGVHYTGHRIIEIGAIEIINRRLSGRRFHVYINPNRPVDPEAFSLHGIDNKFLEDKPKFVDIANAFLHFIYGSELIIHNASFDVGFINYEFEMLNLGIGKITTFCKVIDSLLLARKLFPGKRNSLDALCDRYLIDSRRRTFHSALIDAEILADIFLLMTSNQSVMNFSEEEKEKQYNKKIVNLFQTYPLQKDANKNLLLKVIHAKNEEASSHEKYLDLIYQRNRNCMWRKNFPEEKE